MKNYFKELYKKYLKLKYWYPVISQDNDDDFLCTYIILLHKLKSIRAAKRECPESLDYCIAQLEKIVSFNFTNADKYGEIANDVFDALVVEMIRWDHYDNSSSSNGKK